MGDCRNIVTLRCHPPGYGLQDSPASITLLTVKQDLRPSPNYKSECVHWDACVNFDMSLTILRKVKPSSLLAWQPYLVARGRLGELQFSWRIGFGSVLGFGVKELAKLLLPG